MKTKQFTSKDMDEIIKVLKDDGIIAYRTDTVMGLIGSATSTVAKAKLITVKQRPETKHFPIMVASEDMLLKYVRLSDKNLGIVQRFLPGALTIVAERTGETLALDAETLAVRIVADEHLIEVVSQLNVPIFLTSANISDQPTTKYVSEVLDIFDGLIEGVYMEDALGYEASTIVSLISEQPQILRQGAITLEQIEEEEYEENING